MKITHRLILGVAALLLLASVSSGCNREAKTERKLTLAHAAFAKNDYATAEIEYKNVLGQEPGHPEALKGLGLVWVRQGMMLDGGRILGDAKRKLEKDDEIGLNLALAMLDLGFVADCRKELSELLDRNPGNGKALMILAESSVTPEYLTECVERIAKSNATDQPQVLLASALVQLRRGDIEVGTQTVEKALRADPNFAHALSLQGKLLSMDKQPEKALEAMKKAAGLGGPRSPENIAYARYLMELDKQDEAIAVLKTATGMAPDYLPNWRLLAQIAVAGKNDSEAAAYLAKVFAKSPLDVEAGLLQADIWLRAKEPKKSIELLESISKNLPGRPILEIALSKACLAAGDFRKAAVTLDQVLVAEPRAIEANILRSGLFLKDGQPAEAIRLAEPLYKAQPENVVVQNLMVNAYRAADRPDDAAAILSKQSASSPKSPEPQFQLGILLRGQGKLMEARAAFERVLEISSEHLGAVAQLSSLDHQEGNSDAAMGRVNAFLTSHPDSAPAHLLKAGLSYARKDLKGAEAAAEKSIELDPTVSKAYELLVTIQCGDGRSEQAIARIKQLLERSPNNVGALMCMGSLHQQLGRMDEAKASFQEITKIAPDFAPAYNNVAYLESLVDGRLDQAIENARKARSLAPSDPLIADTLGWIEWQRGNFAQALPLLVEAAGNLTDSATAQYHLGMCHYMLHQVPEAIAGLEKSLAIQGEFPEKEDAKACLTHLRDGGQWDLATLETRLKDKPRDVVLLILKANKLAAAEKTEEALAAYQAALALNPDLEAAYLGQADLYAKALKQPEKALEAATQARKVAPQSARAAATLGQLSFRSGMFQEAHFLLQEASRKLPEDFGVQHDAAWAAYSMGRVDDARSAIGKVAESGSSYAESAREFIALTAPGAAADPTLPERVAKTLEKTPDHVPALMARASIQLKSGENPVETYQKVLGLYPQFDPARVSLARILLDDPKQLDAAEKLATEARQRLTNDPELSAILAMVNFRKGQFDFAAQLLKELSVKRPLTGRELFALGMSQASTKRPEEAKQSLAQALKTDLPEADAAKARTTLEELDQAAADGEK